MLCLRFFLHFLSVLFNENSSAANIEYYLIFKSNTLVLVCQEKSYTFISMYLRYVLNPTAS